MPLPLRGPAPDRIKARQNRTSILRLISRFSALAISVLALVMIFDQYSAWFRAWLFLGHCPNEGPDFKHMPAGFGSYLWMLQAITPSLLALAIATPVFFLARKRLVIARIPIEWILFLSAVLALYVQMAFDPFGVFFWWID